MLIAIDKRGSINLPSSIRKELGLESGTYLDVQVTEGGAVALQPVAIFRTIRLSERGLAKLNEARESGIADMPDWLSRETSDAAADSEQEIS